MAENLKQPSHLALLQFKDLYKESQETNFIVTAREYLERNIKRQLLQLRSYLVFDSGSLCYSCVHFKDQLSHHEFRKYRRKKVSSEVWLNIYQTSCAYDSELLFLCVSN
jgi:hypothetical protein